MLPSPTPSIKGAPPGAVLTHAPGVPATHRLARSATVPKPKVRATARKRQSPRASDRSSTMDDRRSQKLHAPPRGHRWQIAADRCHATCEACGAESRVELDSAADGRLAARILRHGPSRCPRRSWWVPAYHWGVAPDRPMAPWESTRKAGAR